MHQTRRIPIVELNDYLACKLCKGYFIDATTIIECLHTFCRSCIVRYLQKNKYCPVCDVQVHKTRPLLNIRPDKTLQDIVYKLVPRLFQNEMCRRRDFYGTRPDARPSNLEQCGEASYQHILSPDETICLSLNYHGSSHPPRYLRCPAAVSVVHLQKLLRSKYDLTEHHRVDVLHNQDCLNSHLTLMDIAYIYLWRRKGPLELTYRIYENVAKLKLADPSFDANTLAVDSTTDDTGRQQRSRDETQASEWKEVQLRISENGEMCITGMDDTVILNEPVKTGTNNNSGDNCNSQAKSDNRQQPTVVPQKKELPALKFIGKGPSTVVTTATTVTTTTTAITTNAGATVRSSVSVLTTTTTCSSAPTVASDGEVALAAANGKQLNGKHKMQATDSKEEPAVKQSRQKVSNHSASVQNLSNNHPLKRHSQSRRSTEGAAAGPPSPLPKGPAVTVLPGFSPASSPKPPLVPTVFAKQQQPMNSNNAPPPVMTLAPSPQQRWATLPLPSTTTVTTLPCYVPKMNYSPVINVPKVQPSTSSSMARGDLHHQKAPPQPQPQPMPTTPPPPVPNSKAVPAAAAAAASSKPKPANSPVGYKTLRDPPKQWNPQVSRASLLKAPPPDPKLRGAEPKGTRPAKFFKMRNNMPRYLGNPASGVKPLYQVHNSPESERKGGPEPVATTSRPPTADRSEIRKHSIVKIDPKTLKPISEKAPETSSLMSSQSCGGGGVGGDLKINTSSVPIFNPLKLQSSPKSERKSPKSPHSPKPAKGSSPPAKRDKQPNLNYTPPNPFIPNLASPTLSPSQFLYPPGPPGFPAYDPCIMAAYHNLLYGQRMPYPPGPLPGLSLDLNQRKGFVDLPAPTSPKVPALSQPYSPKGPPVSPKVPGACETATKPPPVASAAAPEPSSPKLQQPAKNNGSKRTGKEPGKSEKSLQNTVEKLTLNRVKELTRSEDGGEKKAALNNLFPDKGAQGKRHAQQRDEPKHKNNKQKQVNENGTAAATEAPSKEAVTNDRSKKEPPVNNNDSEVVTPATAPKLKPSDTDKSTNNNNNNRRESALTVTTTTTTAAATDTNKK